MLVTITPQVRPGNDRVAFTPDTRLSAPLLDACASGFPNSMPSKINQSPGLGKRFLGESAETPPYSASFRFPSTEKEASAPGALVPG